MPKYDVTFETTQWEIIADNEKEAIEIARYNIMNEAYNDNCYTVERYEEE